MNELHTVNLVFGEDTWCMTFYMDCHMRCLANDALTTAANAIKNSFDMGELSDLAVFVITGLNTVKMTKYPMLYMLRDDGRLELTNGEEARLNRIIEKLEHLLASDVGQVALIDQNHVALALAPKYYDFCSKRPATERDYC